MLSRYQDGYRVAKFVNGVGQLTKVVGVFIAVVFFIASATLRNTVVTPMRNGLGQISDNIGLVMFLAVLGLVVGFFFWVLGVLICAQGQTLKASLDTAVHGSPFLANDQKASVMSLT
jgi:hypothetical protein